MDLTERSQAHIMPKSIWLVDQRYRHQPYRFVSPTCTVRFPIAELEPAKKLVRDALAAGIMNDMGSGSNVDLVIITEAGSELLRPYDVISEKGERSQAYTYPKETTKVLETKVVFIAAYSFFVCGI